ncbi:hypothetical protein SSCG_01006 [Streptomyces clavuligerus]|nr:hypothetical protein [Streptomyces clavuligerus]EDY47978.1 hypothetical protein SSCG_01006 [Streptomyces clavuligerus]
MGDTMNTIENRNSSAVQDVVQSVVQDDVNHILGPLVTQTPPGATADDGTLLPQDNHIPRGPRPVAAEAEPEAGAAATPPDNHIPPAAAQDALPPDNHIPAPPTKPVAAADIRTLDNHIPAPPRVVRDRAARPLDNHIPAPPRP